MPVDLETLLKKEAFARLDPEKLTLFRSFARDIQGKNTAEIAAVYMCFNRELSKKGTLSASDRQAIAETIRDSLPESDKIKFNGILKMLNIKA